MNPAFTQGVIAPAARTLYVGGQLGTDSTGKLLDGIEAQTTQAMRNVLTVLAAAGTRPQHVVKLTSGERGGGPSSVKKAGAGSCNVHCSPDGGEANCQVAYETGESMTWEKP